MFLQCIPRKEEDQTDLNMIFLFLPEFRLVLKKETNSQHVLLVEVIFLVSIGHFSLFQHI